MKKCKYCGKELPVNAEWCPYCEKSQNQAKKAVLPKRYRKGFIAFVSLIACIILIILLLKNLNGGKVYQGEDQISYKVNGQECTVFLSFRNNSLTTGLSQPEYVDQLADGDNAAAPSQLFAYAQNDPNVQEAFINAVESCSVTAEPEGNAKTVDILGPAPGSKDGFTGAWKADVMYSSLTGTNKICWEVKMKNGDTLRLSHKITCTGIQVIVYHYEDTPMETVDEIHALIQKTADETPDAILKLYLPPVTYEGSLVMDTTTAFLFGSEEDGKKTTFTDTIQVKTRVPAVAEFYDLEFQGNGGIGILSTEGLRLQACAFIGWDTGLEVDDGGWASVNNAAFIGNHTGFRFNSKKSSYVNPRYENVVFAENDTGLEIINVPGDYELSFINPVFDGNKTDITDPAGLVKIE